MSESKQNGCHEHMLSVCTSRKGRGWPNSADVYIFETWKCVGCTSTPSKQTYMRPAQHNTQKHGQRTRDTRRAARGTRHQQQRAARGTPCATCGAQRPACSALCMARGTRRTASGMWCAAHGTGMQHAQRRACTVRCAAHSTWHAAHEGGSARRAARGPRSPSCVEKTRITN